MLLTIACCIIIGLLIILLLQLIYKQKSPSRADFHIIVDNSNVFLGAQNLYDEATRKTKWNPAIRIKVKKLASILEAQKLSSNIRTRLVGGSTPPSTSRVWTEWESCNYKCHLGDRSANNKEVFLDNMLHAQIYDNLLDYENTANHQQVLVLVTGDGNANNGQTSFPKVIERVLTRGWKVELWSWKLSLSKRFQDVQEHFPHQMEIKYLDSYRNDFTFEEKNKKK